MTTDALFAVDPSQAIDAGMRLDASISSDLAANATPVDATGSFGQMVSEGINAVNQELLVSQTDLQQLATGNAQNLHQIMIRMEESRLSFHMLMQVRNRLLEAYQDILKMQV